MSHTNYSPKLKIRPLLLLSHLGLRRDIKEVRRGEERRYSEKGERRVGQASVVLSRLCP